MILFFIGTYVKKAILSYLRDRINKGKKYINGKDKENDRGWADTKGSIPWFLKGNAYRKLGETRLALNSYLEAIAINPDSPAQSAYNMMIQILDFYNKDMYNQ